MLIKTTELNDQALDWTVTKCEGRLNNITQASTWAKLSKERGGIVFTHGQIYSPSTDWAQGGQIIEREKMDFKWVGINNCRAALAGLDGEHFEAIGPTPLIAAMRCFVSSKLGNEVDVPDEICANLKTSHAQKVQAPEPTRRPMRP